jgi:hypothetical protein
MFALAVSERCGRSYRVDRDYGEGVTGLVAFE